MTQVINAPRTARFAKIASVARPHQAEQILRDAAFVMALTQKVKSEMIRPTCRQSSPRLAALVG